MDYSAPPAWLAAVAPILVLLQLTWYVATAVLLVKIWRKVKHLS
jgi:hypothetical protein